MGQNYAAVRDSVVMNEGHTICSTNCWQDYSLEKCRSRKPLSRSACQLPTLPFSIAGTPLAVTPVLLWPSGHSVISSIDSQQLHRSCLQADCHQTVNCLLQEAAQRRGTQFCDYAGVATICVCRLLVGELLDISFRTLRWSTFY